MMIVKFWRSWCNYRKRRRMAKFEKERIERLNDYYN